MKSGFKIAPSLLSADFYSIKDSIDSIVNKNIDMLHFDVMDNHYVPNLTFGPVICKAIKSRCPNLIMDVHLMVQPADQLIEDFAEAGADIISIHQDSVIHLDRALQRIHALGCKAGLAFNPATPLTILETVMHHLDLILIMSVNPGFGGQTFIDHVLPKIEAARTLIDNHNRSILLEVDGGLNHSTLKTVAEAGADTFVMGSALFGHPNFPDVIDDYWTILHSL